jgi:hypothetical protein
MVMALKSKKLHADDIQGIRGFMMAYKCLATFTMPYKKLHLYTESSFKTWQDIAALYMAPLFRIRIAFAK